MMNVCERFMELTFQGIPSHAMKFQRFRGKEFGLFWRTQVPICNGRPECSRETIQRCVHRLLHVRFHRVVRRTQGETVVFVVSNDSNEAQTRSQGMKDISEVPFEETNSFSDVKNVVRLSFLEKVKETRFFSHISLENMNSFCY